MPPKKATPGRWWQWILMYPALLIAIVSAIPTWHSWYLAQRLGVPSGKVQIAQEQQRLWNKNAECLPGRLLEWIPTPASYAVSATVCSATGDVLVMVKDNEGESHGWWVSARTLAKSASKAGHGNFFGGEARAAELPAYSWMLAQSNRRIICQRRLNPREILLRVDTNGRCFDEIINTYTGAVVKRQPAPCNPDCR